jgi:hypothetical protein
MVMPRYPNIVRCGFKSHWWLLVFSLVLGCTEDASVYRWPSELDSYMQELGWTKTADDSQVRLNNKPIIEFFNCLRCINRRYLIPGELIDSVETKFHVDIDVSRTRYLSDQRELLGIREGLLDE